MTRWSGRAAGGVLALFSWRAFRRAVRVSYPFLAQARPTHSLCVLPHCSTPNCAPNIMGRFHQLLVTVLLVALLVGNGSAFSVVSRLNTVGRTDASCQDANGPEGTTTVGHTSCRIMRSPIMTGGAFVSGLLISAAPAFAEEVQYAELPPPYIPVIFGLGLLVVCTRL
jgi:hypothetical protein